MGNVVQIYRYKDGVVFDPIEKNQEFVVEEEMFEMVSRISDEYGFYPYYAKLLAVQENDKGVHRYLFKFTEYPKAKKKKNDTNKGDIK